MVLLRHDTSRLQKKVTSDESGVTSSSSDLVTIDSSLVTEMDAWAVYRHFLSHISTSTP